MTIDSPLAMPGSMTREPFDTFIMVTTGIFYRYGGRLFKNVPQLCCYWEDLRVVSKFINSLSMAYLICNWFLLCLNLEVYSAEHVHSMFEAFANSLDKCIWLSREIFKFGNDNESVSINYHVISIQAFVACLSEKKGLKLIDAKLAASNVKVILMP